MQKHGVRSEKPSGSGHTIQHVKPKEDGFGLNRLAGWIPAPGSPALYHETQHETSVHHNGLIRAETAPGTDLSPCLTPVLPHHLLFIYLFFVVNKRRPQKGAASDTALANENLLDMAHLHRLVGGDEGKHEVEPWAAGGGQESPSPAFTQANYHLLLKLILFQLQKRQTMQVQLLKGLYQWCQT